ncbi:cysteine desulfurase [Cordyceps militaris CM01]|uniref:Cysteine desulfurase n=1 Tax=Cordyceps militaris (strain CM01) TaxID=983644 RepID=G3JEW0_CORMM|nr:cysteine desulfurase [Cordyceps militaris CM01]EGX93453.1 cysteine desulfurase [Cordyceps militaris CM01]
MEKQDFLTDQSLPAKALLERYPEYASTSILDDLRATEYSFLDENGHVYLDYTGAGLAAQSQHQAHRERMRHAAFGNPHSSNPTSRAATDLVDEARARILRYFSASPDEYTVIFTPNATGAARLVGESYPWRRGARLVLTADNHNSLNGLRELARRGKSRTVYVPIADAHELRTRDADVVAALSRKTRCSPRAWLSKGNADASRRRGLFAYPAQSNFTGVRHPLSWVRLAQAHGYDVLLDAAAYLPTARLDLAALRPEFVMVSWYKLFGTRPASAAWWRAATRSVGCAGRGSRAARDGAKLVVCYGPAGVRDRGGTVCFNILDRHGVVLDERRVAAESAAAGISLRTGCFCNPGAGEAALGITGGILARGRAAAAAASSSSYQDFVGALEDGGVPAVGAVRVSLGIASVAADVEYLVAFVEATYRDRASTTTDLAPREGC